jgi:WD40 repeat protein
MTRRKPQHVGTSIPCVSCLAFSQDSKWLCAGFLKGQVRVWSLEKEGEANLIDHHEDSYIPSIDCDWSSRFLVHALRDKIHVCSIPALRSLNVWSFGSLVQGLRCSPAGETVGVVGYAPYAVTYDLRTKARQMTRWRSRYDSDSVAFSSDGTLCTAASDEGRIRIWKHGHSRVRSVLNAWEEIKAGNVPHELTDRYTLGLGAIIASGFLLDNRRLACLRLNGVIEVWELGMKSISLFHDTGRSAAQAGCFIRTGDRLAILERGGRRTSIWSVASGEQLAVIKHANLSASAIACDREGKLLAVGTREGSIKIFSIATGKTALVLPQ